MRQPGSKASGLFLGIDIGTSACRICVIDANQQIVAEARENIPPPETHKQAISQDPKIWWDTLCHTLNTICDTIPTERVTKIALDGTSGSVLLCDNQGSPLTKARMYNDSSAVEEAHQIQQIAPPQSVATTASASLAKALLLRKEIHQENALIRHQADWLTGRLLGNFNYADENNVLKLGYDQQNRCWPDWMSALDLPLDTLPEVVPSGTILGRLDKAFCNLWGFSDTTRIVAGTTDSTAGFIATGASQIATAVTALGSTLVLKVLSNTPVTEPQYGVYSQRLGNQWLVGGASNSGGTVLKKYFNTDEIQKYTALLDSTTSTALNYYPLAGVGERFPINDPKLLPTLEPRPDSDAVFFQGILEGISDIETRGYKLLHELGAPYPSKVITVGGGAINTGWTKIRANQLGVNVESAKHSEAAFGAALLASTSA